MFDHTLLDSGRSREPALRGAHGWIGLAAGALAFLVPLFVLRILFVPLEPKALLAPSAMAGCVVFCTTLMLCYVVADARRSGLSVRPWFSLVLLLNLAAFLIYLVRSACKTGDWKRATVPAAYILEVILLGALAVAPLMYTEALPKHMPWITVPLPPAPRGTSRATPSAAKITRPPVFVDLTQVPPVIPNTIPPVHDEHAPPAWDAPLGVVDGVPGVPDGSLGGVFNSIGLARLLPPPAPASKSARIARIRVGGQVEAARLIFQPRPEYPPLARMAGIQGTVRLEAVISRDGTIDGLKVLSGHPLLVKAAAEAVSRWRYQPTLLNGDPVEVVTEIEVNFTLAE